METKDHPSIRAARANPQMYFVVMKTFALASRARAHVCALIIIAGLPQRSYRFLACPTRFIRHVTAAECAFIRLFGLVDWVSARNYARY